MSSFPFAIKKNLLLTGAGFTANFNGFDSKQLGIQIFNHIFDTSKIKQLLFENLARFEPLYYKVLFEEPEKFSEEEKQEFKNAVKKAYEDLDDIVCQFGHRGRSGYGLFYGNLSRFIGNAFAGSNSGERGAIFTLNQDLFLERVHGFKSPMLHAFAFVLQGNFNSLDKTHFKRFPTQVEMNTDIDNYVKEHFKSDGDLFYFKLHGSYGWLTSDGTDLMVLGDFKKKQIEEEPLLKWYYGCFKEALWRDDVQLLIIGYSFNDTHINDILREAFKYGMRFCILTPKEHVDGQLNSIKQAGLEKGLYKIFPYALRELFPEDQSNSPQLREVLEVFPANR